MKVRKKSKKPVKRKTRWLPELCDDLPWIIQEFHMGASTWI